MANRNQSEKIHRKQIKRNKKHNKEVDRLIREGKFEFKLRKR